MDQAWPLAAAGIDWQRPWFESMRGPGKKVARQLAAGLPLAKALNMQPGAPVRFVGQEELPSGQPYEHYIRSSGNCPVREGLHDLFNGLAWLALPLAKARLNQLQAAEIATDGVRGVRGPVRDAITIFDENGALLDAPAALWQALCARDWRRLFIDLRPLWKDARLLVLGHATLEKLVSPRKEHTVHVWRAQCAMNSIANTDAWLAGELTAARLATKPFTPLPILGIPGWWPENQNFSFYDDSLVFRPGRHQKPHQTGRPPA
ncbi:MAG: DUF3025 domain-containing protein [Comamonadaceae bacterium]|nr:MAG: DUF3025 domain-containing protein [Comamonadaceae bacterium]